MIYSMPRKIESELVVELKAMTDRKFGLTITARELGFTPQFILDVVKGRRGVTENLAKAMGYIRIVEFEAFTK